MRSILAAALCVLALPLFATQPNPSQKQREIIEELMQVTNMGKVVHDFADASLAQVHESMMKKYANLGEEFAEEAKQDSVRLRELIRASDLEGVIRQLFIQLYAKYFTEDELRDMVAFYRTPTGQKSMQVFPQLMAESMQSAETLFQPIFEKAWKQVEDERNKRKPWRKTMIDIRELADAIESYAEDEESYPKLSLSDLKELLEPDYIDALPMKDVWGHELAYVTSDDGAYYRIVSAGEDGIFEWDSRRIVLGERPIRYSENLEDDIIFADGQFVQAPAVSKPKTDQ